MRRQARGECAAAVAIKRAQGPCIRSHASCCSQPRRRCECGTYGLGTATRAVYKPSTFSQKALGQHGISAIRPHPQQTPENSVAPVGAAVAVAAGTCMLWADGSASGNVAGFRAGSRRTAGAGSGKDVGAAVRAARGGQAGGASAGAPRRRAQHLAGPRRDVHAATVVRPCRHLRLQTLIHEAAATACSA